MTTEIFYCECINANAEDYIEDIDISLKDNIRWVVCEDCRTIGFSKGEKYESNNN
tara:strand:- start:104 stop:268 length:165 start_codon:yes stop_codon:yes gene_type:complete